MNPISSNFEVNLNINQSLDPKLAKSIRENLGKQEGAMSLFNDLMKKPFNEDINTILKRLNKGCYGNETCEDLGILFPGKKLRSDLDFRGFTDLLENVEDRYKHLRPLPADW